MQPYTNDGTHALSVYGVSPARDTNSDLCVMLNNLPKSAIGSRYTNRLHSRVCVCNFWGYLLRFCFRLHQRGQRLKPIHHRYRRRQRRITQKLPSIPHRFNSTFSVSSYLFPFLPIVVIFLIHIALAGALMAGDHADFYGRRPTIRMFDLQTSSPVKTREIHNEPIIDNSA